MGMSVLGGSPAQPAQASEAAISVVTRVAVARFISHLPPARRETQQSEPEQEGEFARTIVAIRHRAASLIGGGQHGTRRPRLRGGSARGLGQILRLDLLGGALVVAGRLRSG